MNNTDKIYCRMSAQALHEYGIEYVVTSPGSRNAPLIVALNKEPNLNVLSVIDERSAAFIALGIATATMKPVAIACTSGSALLNYAPALSEAYYRHIPIVCLSADRTANRIGQNDSQTIRQFGALSSIVKSSYDISESDDKSFVNRKLNEAMQIALTAPQAPVHINIQISEPLNGLTEVYNKDFRKVEYIKPEYTITQSELHRLVSTLQSKRKVMILVGFHQLDKKFEHALKHLATSDNIAVLYEAQSNLMELEEVAIGHIDITLNTMPKAEREEMQPELIITLGGSVTSNFVKKFLRETQNLEHWNIGRTNTLIDTYDAATENIQIDDTCFVTEVANALKDNSTSSNYNKRWQDLSRRAKAHVEKYSKECIWSDFKAMSTLLSELSNCNLQLSNGTAVRYTQLFNYSKFNRIDCNRGVSGIDGCTSTAIGASLINKGHTVLITGDMCAQYDLGALAANCISPKFKMIVLNNAGGGIFRFIKATRDLEELDQFIACKVNLPVEQLAKAFGFAYFEATNDENLCSNLKTFMAETSRPAIFNIITNGTVSAEVLLNFYKSKQ
jgi:2-succinyl-5-enolpyruvyl-6-hydroxy-3-cyclohexene-1-carboxylate synthase